MPLAERLPPHLVRKGRSIKYNEKIIYVYQSLGGYFGRLNAGFTLFQTMCFCAWQSHLVDS